MRERRKRLRTVISGYSLATHSAQGSVSLATGIHRERHLEAVSAARRRLLSSARRAHRAEGRCTRGSAPARGPRRRNRPIPVAAMSGRRLRRSPLTRNSGGSSSPRRSPKRSFPHGLSPRPRPDLVRNLLVAEIRAIRGVRMNLGAIDGDQPKVDQPRPGAQHQHLAEQARQRVLMIAAKVRQRRMIRHPIGTDDPVGNLLPAPTLNHPRRAALPGARRNVSAAF